MNFTQWLEQEKKNSWTLEIISASAHSSGYHAFGDTPELPAGDCRENIEWSIPFLRWPKQVEKLLVDAEATITSQDNSFSSYHECQVAFHVWAHIEDATIAEKLIQMLKPFETENESEIWKDKYFSNRNTHYPFTGFKEAVLSSIQRENKNLKPPEELVGKAPMLKPPTKPGESSEDYWKRKIQADEMQAKIQKRKDWKTREGH